MVLESEVIELKKLYDFVLKDKKNEALEGRSKQGKEYGKLVKELTNPISENGGFYIWGSYTKKGLWNNIYIGKAGFSETTGLRARIKEELKDERSFIWLSKMNKKNILKLGAIKYPAMWEKKYKTNTERAFRKFNSTHIIWIAIKRSDKEEMEKDILKIESDLIETMNPIANRNRPKPYGDLQKITIEIIKRMKHHIHEKRGDKLFIPKEILK
ncbi:MAG: hypothetical protein AB8H03_16745 [Saprospiraceae bacterium]